MAAESSLIQLHALLQQLPTPARRTRARRHHRQTASSASAASADTAPVSFSSAAPRRAPLPPMPLALPAPPGPPPTSALPPLPSAGRAVTATWPLALAPSPLSPASSSSSTVGLPLSPVSPLAPLSPRWSSPQPPPPLCPTPSPVGAAGVTRGAVRRYLGRAVGNELLDGRGGSPAPTMAAEMTAGPLWGLFVDVLEGLVAASEAAGGASGSGDGGVDAERLALLAEKEKEDQDGEDKYMVEKKSAQTKKTRLPAWMSATTDDTGDMMFAMMVAGSSGVDASRPHTASDEAARKASAESKSGASTSGSARTSCSISTSCSSWAHGAASTNSRNSSTASLLPSSCCPASTSSSSSSSAKCFPGPSLVPPVLDPPPHVPLAPLDPRLTRADPDAWARQHRRRPPAVMASTRQRVREALSALSPKKGSSSASPSSFWESATSSGKSGAGRARGRGGERLLVEAPPKAVRLLGLAEGGDGR